MEGGFQNVGELNVLYVLSIHVKCITMN